MEFLLQVLNEYATRNVHVKFKSSGRGRWNFPIYIKNYNIFKIFSHTFFDKKKLFSYTVRYAVARAAVRYTWDAIRTITVWLHRDVRS